MSVIDVDMQAHLFGGGVQEIYISAKNKEH